MKETILLFNPPAKDELIKIEMALFPLHVRLRRIQPEDYNQPLGALAGVKDIPPAEGKYEGDELPGTPLRFLFLQRQQIKSGARRSEEMRCRTVSI